MTKEEVKDERRSMDGDPQARSWRARMMRELALQRINAAVPRASVVVTNPTHYSVAIEYDADTMRVACRPRASTTSRSAHPAGRGDARSADGRAPAAGALYANVEVGQEISPEFYEAVAELLAYVYRLEAQAA